MKTNAVAAKTRKKRKKFLPQISQMNADENRGNQFFTEGKQENKAEMDRARK